MSASSLGAQGACMRTLSLEAVIWTALLQKIVLHAAGTNFRGEVRIPLRLHKDISFFANFQCLHTAHRGPLYQSSIFSPQLKFSETENSSFRNIQFEK